VIWFALLFLAFLCATPLIYFFHATATQDKNVIRRQKRPVRVAFRPRPKKKQIKRKVKPDPLDGQVVEVREPEKEIKPKRKAKFLARYNTATAKETKAKNRNRRRAPTVGAPAPKDVSRIQSRNAKSLRPSKTNKRKPKNEKKVTPKAQPPRPKDKGTESSKKSVVDRSRTRPIMPTVDEKSAIANMQALTGSSAGNEVLIDIDEGAETVLNTRRFQYFDFFATVKERVRKHWFPVQAYRRSDPTGKIYGVKDRLTVLGITLSKDGQLTRIVTLKNSGNPQLDQAARTAFRKAAPFVNPPVGLVRGETIQFRFGFLFEIGTKRFKFFRM
jgi:TonB family protein